MRIDTPYKAEQSTICRHLNFVVTLQISFNSRLATVLLVSRDRHPILSIYSVEVPRSHSKLALVFDMCVIPCNLD